MVAQHEGKLTLEKFTIQAENLITVFMVLDNISKVSKNLRGGSPPNRKTCAHKEGCSQGAGEKSLQAKSFALSKGKSVPGMAGERVCFVSSPNSISLPKYFALATAQPPNQFFENISSVLWLK